MTELCTPLGLMVLLLSGSMSQSAKIKSGNVENGHNQMPNILQEYISVVLNHSLLVGNK